MPLVRISLRQGTTPEYRKAIANGVHRAMLEALAVPVDDRFQVLTEHDAGGLIYDPQFLGIERSDRVVFVQIALSAGRKPSRSGSSINAWRRSSPKIRVCARKTS